MAVCGGVRIVYVRLLEVCVSLPVVCGRLLVNCNRLCSFVVVCGHCLF